MQVPLSPDAAAARTRLHEMAHVRWTPANGHDQCPTVPFETLNAVEDCRIHRRLHEIGLGHALRAPILEDDTWNGIDRTMQAAAEGKPDPRMPWRPIDVARFYAAAIGTPEEGIFEHVAGSHGFGWVLPMVRDMYNRHLAGRRPAFKRAVAMAEELEETFGDMPEDPLAGDEDMRNLRDLFADDGSAEWGTMTVREMPLVQRLPAAMRARKRRATDTGAVPRNWHRIPTDGRVFAMKRKRPSGGTVLIDQSGSMSLSPEQVLEIMAAFPAVTIATYAGSDWTGELRIIARNGRRASDKDCYHPMKLNIIDGPALEWLAGMPEPRVWVSDGHVTGKGESQNRALVADAGRIMQRGRITRVETLDGVIVTE